ncbi:class I fructose-bisphosphate aldolase [Acidovorax sp. A1169]|uniref:class I fructose-bisphosphate aldolase n=1 Tax=Acidovorax sp. A1169 TaxID=3059524 RepID=UPI00351F86B2
MSNNLSRLGSDVGGTERGNRLIETAHAMVAPNKGLLAIDESNGTCDKRLESAGIAPTVEMRRAYRDLLITTPGLNQYINGLILCDETIWQTTADGTPFVEVARDAGILVGIKVDAGATRLAAHPGETVTEGLDGLRARLRSYTGKGARFAKWRATIKIHGDASPTRACLEANAHALARYAAICQEEGLVPIIEPEVLMDGFHNLERCQQVSEALLRHVFEQLNTQGVLLEEVVLKTNVVFSGLEAPTTDEADDVADATIQCLLRTVPAAVAGIAFLSGGQSGKLASTRLNAMHVRYGTPSQPSGAPGATVLPWQLSFSFARALQHPALEIWAGLDANRAEAQQALIHRSRCNSLAIQGRYSETPESA